MEQINFFINLNHVFEQFRERAHAPTWPDARIEAKMRDILEEALEKDDFLENRHTNEKLCRIAIPGLQVVYAVLEPGHPDGKYKWMIHTVLAQDMYHQWSKESRIGTLGDRLSDDDARRLANAIKNRKPVRVLMESKKEPEEEEVMFLIKVKKGNCSDTKEIPENKVSSYIFSLLKGGTSLKDIKVYKPTEFKLSVEFGGE